MPCSRADFISLLNSKERDAKVRFFLQCALLFLNYFFFNPSFIFSPRPPTPLAFVCHKLCVNIAKLWTCMHVNILPEFPAGLIEINLYFCLII